MVAAFFYVDYLSSLGVVHSDADSIWVTTDQDAFTGYFHPEPTVADVSELRKTGRLFRIQSGIECKILERLPGISCDGEHYELRVRIRTGDLRGRVLRICSSNVSMKMAWP